jgi:hypothetical protein
MPFLCQLNQVRSKFNQLSNYTRCRFSSDLAFPLELQPCLIWTLADQDTTGSNLSQEKIGPSVFQKIAVSVVRNGENAVFKTSDLLIWVSNQKEGKLNY